MCVASSQHLTEYKPSSPGRKCLWLTECVCVSKPLNILSWSSNSCYLLVFQQSAYVLVFAWAKLECIKHKCFLCVYLCSAHVQTLNRRTLFVCVIPPNGGVNKHEFVLSCFLPSRQLLWYTSSTAVLSAKDNKARLDRDMHHIVTLQYVRQLQTSSWHGNVPLKCVNAPSLRCSSFKLLSLAWLSSCF